jgi:hypothetical protein
VASSTSTKGHVALGWHLDLDSAPLPFHSRTVIQEYDTSLLHRCVLFLLLPATFPEENPAAQRDRIAFPIFTSNTATALPTNKDPCRSPRLTGFPVHATVGMDIEALKEQWSEVEDRDGLRLSWNVFPSSRMVRQLFRTALEWR